MLTNGKASNRKLSLFIDQFYFRLILQVVSELHDKNVALNMATIKLN